MTNGSTIRSFLRNTVGARLRSQLSALRFVLILLYAPVALLFAFLVVIRIRTGITLTEFTADPLGYSDIPVYTGSVSNLGVMIWSGAAAVCYFGAGLIRVRAGGDAGVPFLLAAGFVTTLLTLDDVFLLHERVIPRYLGVPEEVVYLSYVVLLLGFVVWFRSIVVRTSFLLLALAFAGFGLSVSGDHIAPYVIIPGRYVLEDGGKLFGIVSWAAYFVSATAQILNSGRHIGSTDCEATAVERAAGSGRSRTP